MVLDIIYMAMPLASTSHQKAEIGVQMIAYM